MDYEKLKTFLTQMVSLETYVYRWRLFTDIKEKWNKLRKNISTKPYIHNDYLYKSWGIFYFITTCKYVLDRNKPIKDPYFRTIINESQSIDNYYLVWGLFFLFFSSERSL